MLFLNKIEWYFALLIVNIMVSVIVSLTCALVGCLRVHTSSRTELLCCGLTFIHLSKDSGVVPASASMF